LKKFEDRRWLDFIATMKQHPLEERVAQHSFTSSACVKRPATSKAVLGFALFLT
jgi:hypothetical protein